MATSSPERRSWWIAVGLLATLALALRLIGSFESPAGDELTLYNYIEGHSLGDVLSSVTESEKTPPLGFVLSWLTSQLGPVEQWMRAPSVIAGTAIVPLTALLGRRTAGAASGLAAAAFAAVSPFLLYYGVEARAYSLAVGLACAATVLLLAACDGSERWRWIAWSIVSSLALMSHYTTVFVIAAAAGWAFAAHPAIRRRLIAASLGIALLSAAWLPFLISQWGNSADEARRIAALAPLSLDTLLETTSRSLLGHPLWSALTSIDLDQVPGPVGLGLILTGLVLGLVGSLRDWYLAGHGRPRPSTDTTLLILLALASPVGLILLSLEPDRSLLLPRNMLASVPAALILASIPLTRLRRPANLIAVALVAGGLGIGAVLELAAYPRPRMKDAAEAISRTWQPGDPILETIWFNGPPTDLSLYLSPEQRKSLELTRTVAQKPFFYALFTKRPVFTISPTPRSITGPLSPPPQLRRFYRLAWSRTWEGMLNVTAAEWRPIEGKPDGR